MTGSYSLRSSSDMATTVVPEKLINDRPKISNEVPNKTENVQNCFYPNPLDQVYPPWPTYPGQILGPGANPSYPSAGTKITTGGTFNFTKEHSSAFDELKGELSLLQDKTVFSLDVSQRALTKLQGYVTDYAVSKPRDTIYGGVIGELFTEIESLNARLEIISRYVKEIDDLI